MVELRSNRRSVSPPPLLDSGAFIEILGSPRAYVRTGLPKVLTKPTGRIRSPEPPPSRPALLADPSDAAIACAHLDHGHSKADIARHLGIYSLASQHAARAFRTFGVWPEGGDLVSYGAGLSQFGST